MRLVVDAKEHEIQLFDRTLGEAVSEIVSLVPCRNNLIGATLILSDQEEYGLDMQLNGMHWPAYFGMMLQEEYQKSGSKCSGFGFRTGGSVMSAPPGHITFEILDSARQ